MSQAALWHDVECGGYSADLVAWEGLADRVDGRVLELGCGTGRVALHLARRGRDVWGVDADPVLVEALDARASREGLAVSVACADVCALALHRDFELIIAPMQLVQMLGGAPRRRAALERIADHLTGGGRFAAAIVELPAASLNRPVGALPDIRERDGWVYSSLPMVVPVGGGGLEIRRRRHLVAPDGALSEEDHTDRLDPLDAAGLEAEAAAVGLQPIDRLDVPPSDGYLGSTILVLGGA